MVRVLMAADSLDVGGAELHVVGLAAALARSGHAAAIATSVDGSLSQTARDSGVPVWPLVGGLVKRRVSLAYTLALRAALRREHFEVIHAHMYASTVAVALASLGMDVPLIVTEHSEATWRGRDARLLSRLAYRRAHTMIAVSTGISQRLQKVDHVPPWRIAVIPNALPDLPRVRHACDLPRHAPGELWIGVVSRLQSEKGITDFLVAAARIADAVPAARFLIVGDGPDRTRLTTLSRQLGLEARVDFLGSRPDVQAVLEQLDVLVVPSRSEGTPLVVLEAMDAGLPLVATRVGGIPEQVREGREGLLVPARDPDALADAVLAIVSDRTWAKRLGESARARVRTAFDHVRMVQRTLGVYHSAVSNAASHRTTVRTSASP